MRIRSFCFADIFNNAPQICFAPDGGDGSGGGGTEGGTAVADEDDEGREEETIPKSEVERLIKERVDRQNRESRKKDQELKSQQKKIAELEEKLRNIGADGGTGDDGNVDAKTVLGKLEVQKQKHERELEAIRSQLAEAEKARLAAVERQRMVERDTELQQALVAADAIDLVAGQRYFVPQIEWDDTDEKWLFKTKAGNLLSIQEGVAEELPKWMRKSQMAGGGSGTSGSRDQKRVAAQNQLKDEEAKLEKMQKEMRKSGNDPLHISHVFTQQQLIKRLKNELARK